MAGMTPRREARDLAEHGHELGVLSPAAIAQAAEQDIRSKLHNSEVRGKRRDFTEYPRGSETRRQIPKVRAYAFLAQHVLYANTALQIVDAALSKPIGTHIRARNTYLIYRDREQLKRARLILIENSNAVTSSERP